MLLNNITSSLVASKPIKRFWLGDIATSLCIFSRCLGNGRRPFKIGGMLVTFYRLQNVRYNCLKNGGIRPFHTAFKGPSMKTFHRLLCAVN